MLYKIGTRVRIIGSSHKSTEYNIGAEGIVVGYSSLCSYPIEVGIKGNPAPSGGPWLCRPEHLEPILYDGNDIRTWEEFPYWQPERENA
jgi:hypothetical protein